MKNLIYRVLMILSIIVIVFSIFSTLELDFFGFRMFRVGSGSMEPYLKVGDFIIIKQSDNYKVGDIISFKEEDNYITHRITVINGDAIITKGDANNTSDKPILKDDIIGKVIYKLDTINYIDELLSKPISWIVLFVVGLLITIMIPDRREKGKHANW